MQKGKQYEILRPPTCGFPFVHAWQPDLPKFWRKLRHISSLYAVNEAVNSCFLWWAQQFLIAWISYGFQIIVSSGRGLGNRMKWSVYFYCLDRFNFPFVFVSIVHIGWFVKIRPWILDVLNYILCRYFYIYYYLMNS